MNLLGLLLSPILAILAILAAYAVLMLWWVGKVLYLVARRRLEDLSDSLDRAFEAWLK
jgi:hypothetical protein